MKFRIFCLCFGRCFNRSW